MKVLKWIQKFVKRYELSIVFSISVAAGLILYFFDTTREFGINVLTELSFVWITVFLVNRIIEKRERKKRVAIDQRILSQTVSIIASYFSIWKHLIWLYFPKVKINSIEGLIARYEDIINVTELSARFELVSIHDPESWKLFFHNRTVKECFENYHTILQSDLHALIDDFKIHLEPQLLGLLLEIGESNYFREVNSVFGHDATDVINEFGQDTNKLSSYMSASTAHFDKLIQLNNYCHQFAERISEFSKTTPKLYNPKVYFTNPLTAYPSP